MGDDELIKLYAAASFPRMLLTLLEMSPNLTAAPPSSELVLRSFGEETGILRIYELTTFLCKFSTFMSASIPNRILTPLLYPFPH